MGKRKVVIVIGPEYLEHPERHIAVIADEIPFCLRHMADHPGADAPFLPGLTGRNTGNDTRPFKADLPDRCVEVPMKVSAATGTDLDECRRKRIGVSKGIGFENTYAAPESGLCGLVEQGMMERARRGPLVGPAPVVS